MRTKDFAGEQLAKWPKERPTAGAVSRKARPKRKPSFHRTHHRTNGTLATTTRIAQSPVVQST
jgi:hypothetical protein